MACAVHAECVTECLEKTSSHGRLTVVSRLSHGRLAVAQHRGPRSATHSLALRCFVYERVVRAPRAFRVHEMEWMLGARVDAAGHLHRWILMYSKSLQIVPGLSAI